jgi:hypothetical protein
MIILNVTKYLGGQSLLITTRLINQMPTRILDWSSPFEVSKRKNGGLLLTRVFGYVCFVIDNIPTIGKLDSRALKCLFISYKMN